MARAESAGKSLYLEVAAQIENAIVRGEWRPGQRLPTLVELAAHFSVSRTVIREACGVLTGCGLLELRQGDGTYVKEFSLEAVLRPMHAALLLGSSDIKNLLEVSLWLEQGMASLAAHKRSDAHCDRLSQALFAMEVGFPDMSSLWEAERAFHLTIADASGNSVGANLLRILYQPLLSVCQILGRDQDFVHTVVSLHRAICDSVCHRDAASADRQMALYRRQLLERALHLREEPILENL